MNLDEWGLIGVFIAGATPWLEAIAVVPAAILLGLNPTYVVVSAVIGNALTIVLFAFSGARIREWLMQRRRSRGKAEESPRILRAQRAFDRWGVYGLAALGPLFIGTQFAAVVAVAAGVRPAKTSALVIAATVVWASLIAGTMMAVGLDEFPALTGNR